MNAKRAKALRKIARDNAVPGAPEKQLVYRAGNGGTAINAPRSVRGIYRRLKRMARGEVSA